MDMQTDHQNFLPAIHDKAIQNTKIMEMRGTDLCNSINVDTCVQMDRVYYMALPEQLDDILGQLKINRTDLTHCMECKQATLLATKAVEQQTQLIHNIRKQTQADVCQELQQHRTEILQDVQFQLNLLAETYEQNHIIHLRHQEAKCPPWEWLPMPNTLKTAILEQTNTSGPVLASHMSLLFLHNQSIKQ